MVMQISKLKGSKIFTKRLQKKPNRGNDKSDRTLLEHGKSSKKRIPKKIPFLASATNQKIITSTTLNNIQKNKIEALLSRNGA